MSLPDEVDDAFLLAIDAAEAAAFEDSAKRRRLSTTPYSSPTPATPPTASDPEESAPNPHRLLERRSAIGGGGYADAGGKVEEKACPCGAGSCLVLTSNTPRNPGRKFYKCPMRDNGGCNFFEWCDTPSPGLGNARSNTVFQSETSSVNMPCPCGAGTCLILTAKTGTNVGKQFYRCPGKQLRAGALLQASPQYQANVMSSSQNSSKRSSSACFKCGEENHWAKDCPNQPSDPYPDKGGRTLTSASSADACFKCGKAGHWSRDCPTLNSGGGTGASHVKSSSTLGSWNGQRY
ncbi:hypothetical protein PR202_ga13712 [Eleusine coracana subsp. coracana]|uniref:Uncharacterized protein n=1 Tax=Eleusine coracana subsp. coracana TaxID=191504 RepID=A0AAV5CF13_ELECO|nr:hypothetical protein PR202_ga13712 [Eleusine coracana subsp. coracana]